MKDLFRKHWFWAWSLTPSLEREFRSKRSTVVNKWLRMGMVMVSISTWVTCVMGGWMQPDRLWDFLGYGFILQAVYTVGFATSFLNKPTGSLLPYITPFALLGFTYVTADLMLKNIPLTNLTGAHTVFVVAIFVTYIFEKLDVFVGLLTGLVVGATYLIMFNAATLPGITVGQVIFHVTAANLIGYAICYYQNRTDRERFVLELELQRSKDQTEDLLNRIIPASINKRLRNDEMKFADYFTETTVIFIDLVGFTQLASTHSPTHLVRVIDELFSEFDRRADYHSVEKVKTVGDAYMAVAGCPKPDPQHAINVARFALDLPPVLERINDTHGISLQMRIGIHSGPVVGGIIGDKRFGFDIWGDTVNVASRLEGLAAPNTIRISETTAASLTPEFITTTATAISVKGRGMINQCELLRYEEQPDHEGQTA